MSKTPKIKIKSAREFIDCLKKLDSVRQQLFSKAENNILKDDRLALIISYCIVEMILDILVRTFCNNGARLLNSNISFTTKAILLNEIRVIDDELLNNLIAIKKLRDLVAHNIVNNIAWQNKFRFDKSDLNYNKFVEDFGEPIDLVEHLFCIWSKLHKVGQEAFLNI